MTQQNLCLICCYSFQEKPNRFISDEARESFDKFSKQLGLPLHGGGGECGGSSLRLPFGGRITVCGDCLSLVGIYVQRRAVQHEKEEHLLKLQEEVCKAVRELTRVVEDVQCHIDQLHSTVKMGDDKTLGEFIDEKKGRGRGGKKMEGEARSFREKVLALNTGAGTFERKDVRRPSGREELVVIKTERMDSSSSPPLRNVDPPTFWDNGLEDSTIQGCTESSQFENGAFSNAGEDTHDFSDSELYQNEEDPLESGGDDERDEDDRKDVEWTVGKTETLTPRGPRRAGRRPNPASLRRPGLSRRYGELLTLKKAAQWKNDLCARVTANPNQQMDPGPSGPPDDAPHFQVLNGQLQLGEVTVKICESKRMIECSRCYKQFYTERHGGNEGEGIFLEVLMRNHIIDKHDYTLPCKPEAQPEVPSKSRPVTSDSGTVELEVTLYSSQSRNRTTYKLADVNRYSYHRRHFREGHGPTYYRCDYRKGGCGASICFKNGKYYRLVKGWNEDGTHTAHAPDVEKTIKMMAMGMAKEMYVNDPTKTIDEVCNFVRSQVGGDEETLPIRKLKRTLRFAKFGSWGMAPEEKMALEQQQCCYCGRIFKDARGLSRHMSMEHSEEEGRRREEESGGGVRGGE